MEQCAIISCRTLKKELMAVIEETGCPYPVYFLPQQLHSNPNALREYLQNLIDRLENVERILLCVSGCGGGTKGLTATSADLVIPRTSDCVDILLSGKNHDEIQRDPKGVFMTKSWVDSMKNSALDFETTVRNRGKEQAVAAARRIYAGFEHFYIIDTGTYDIRAVQEYLAPLIDAIEGTVDIIPGEYRVLRDLISGNWGKMFQIVPKGGIVK